MWDSKLRVRVLYINDGIPKLVAGAISLQEYKYLTRTTEMA